jgi:hypothetical protein
LIECYYAIDPKYGRAAYWRRKVGGLPGLCSNPTTHTNQALRMLFMMLVELKPVTMAGTASFQLMIKRVSIALF